MLVSDGWLRLSSSMVLIERCEEELCREERYDCRERVGRHVVCLSEMICCVIGEE